MHHPLEEDQFVSTYPPFHPYTAAERYEPLSAANLRGDPCAELALMVHFDGLPTSRPRETARQAP